MLKYIFSVILQCKAGSCLKTAGQTENSEISTCDTTDGQCKCGTLGAILATCTSGSTTPKCLADDGTNPPTLESTAGTTCKVN